MTRDNTWQKKCDRKKYVKSETWQKINIKKSVLLQIIKCNNNSCLKKKKKRRRKTITLNNGIKENQDKIIKKNTTGEVRLKIKKVRNISCKQIMRHKIY